jgi:hypothetical protein
LKLTKNFLILTNFSFFIRLKEKEKELAEKVKFYEDKLRNSESEIDSLKSKIRHKPKEIANYLLASDLISLYGNLNSKYRAEAFESLRITDQGQNVKDFKLKLLFSVIVVSFILFLKVYNHERKVSFVNLIF